MSGSANCFSRKRAMLCKACHLKKAVCFFGEQPPKKVQVDKADTDWEEGSSCKAGKEAEVINMDNADSPMMAMLLAGRFIMWELRGLKQEMVEWRRESVAESQEWQEDFLSEVTGV